MIVKEKRKFNYILLVLFIIAVAVVLGVLFYL